MLTPRKGRMINRIERSKARKSERFYTFLRKIAARKCNVDVRHAYIGFCCVPEHLRIGRRHVTLAEFVSSGEKLAGGRAYLFKDGYDGCRHVMPSILLMDELEKRYNPDGSYKY